MQENLAKCNSQDYIARMTNLMVRRVFLVVVFYLSLSMILRGLGLRLF